MEKQMINLAIKLTKEVAKYPCLYDVSVKATNHMQQQAWQVVAKAMNMNVTACKETWLDIQNTYKEHVNCNNNPKEPHYLTEVMTPILVAERPNIKQEPTDEKQDKAQNSDEKHFTNCKTNVNNRASNVDKPEDKCANRCKKRLRGKDSDQDFPTTSMPDNAHSPDQKRKLKRTSTEKYLDYIAEELVQLNDEQQNMFKQKCLKLIDDCKNKMI